MSISIDSNNPGSMTFPSGANVTAAVGAQWNHTYGAALSAGVLFVLVGQDSGGASTGVVWDNGGSNIALAKKGENSTGNARAEIWWKVAPAVTGTKQIRVDWSGSHNGCCGSISYDGVHQSGTFNAASPQTAGSGTGDPTIDVTSANGEWVLDCFVQDLGSVGQGVTPDVQTGVCGGVNTNTGSIQMGASTQASTGATTTLGWGLTANPSGAWAQVAVSIIPAGAGGGDLSTGVGAIGEPVVGGSSF